jgi:hypothetical protein
MTPGTLLPPRALPRPSLLVSALLAPVVWCLTPLPASSHQAAAGWTYPAECCSGIDCYEVAPSEVAPRGDGWVVVATGEYFARGWYRESPDGRFHRCSAGSGDRRAHTYCLFVPPLGL